jgi:hypothetical protein
MTPTGMGVGILAPLIRHGFIDWMISTGANLYHDMHFGLGFDLYTGNPFVDDVKLREEGTIRIYDIVLATTCCSKPMPSSARFCKPNRSRSGWELPNFTTCWANMFGK